MKKSRFLIITLFVLSLSGCAPKPITSSAPAPAVAEPATMAEALESCRCGVGEFRGEYMLLRGADIGSFHNNEGVALGKLQNKLREESFWNDWEYEILQWRPLCE